MNGRVNHGLKEWEEGVRATDREAEAQTTEGKRDETLLRGKESEDESGKTGLERDDFGKGGRRGTK